MQKQPSISEAKEEISDLQNDPLLQKLFDDAVEVLRLAGAEEKATGNIKNGTSPYHLSYIYENVMVYQGGCGSFRLQDDSPTSRFAYIFALLERGIYIVFSVFGRIYIMHLSMLSPRVGRLPTGI